MSTMTMGRVELGQKPLAKRAKLKCCFEPSRCTNGTYWVVWKRDGSIKDAKPYCRKHFEQLWQQPNMNIHDFKIVRLGGLEWG